MECQFSYLFWIGEFFQSNILKTYWGVGNMKIIVERRDLDFLSVGHRLTGHISYTGSIGSSEYS